MRGGVVFGEIAGGAPFAYGFALLIIRVSPDNVFAAASRAKTWTPMMQEAVSSIGRRPDFVFAVAMAALTSFAGAIRAAPQPPIVASTYDFIAIAGLCTGWAALQASGSGV
jgi:hypothetical protein